MESNSTTSELEGRMPPSVGQALQVNGNDMFCINTAIDHHTIQSSTYAKRIRGNCGFVRERRFLEYSMEGIVSRNSIYLDRSFVCQDFNNLSPGCLVQNGYEIKLSNRNSYVMKDGQKLLKIHFFESFWVADVHSFEPIGFVKDITSSSTKNIIQKIREEHAKVVRKAEIDKQHRLFKNEQQAKCRGGNIAWVLNSKCSVHTINNLEHLTNVRSWTDSNGYLRWVGDYQLGNLLLKDVHYCKFDLSNFLSLNRLAIEGFQIYLTNEKATVTKDGEVCLVVPMVGKFWILNSLHEQYGWLKKGCPYEVDNMFLFESRYGNEFTREEIIKAFQELSHECELEGPMEL